MSSTLWLVLVPFLMLVVVSVVLTLVGLAMWACALFTPWLAVRALARSLPHARVHRELGKPQVSEHIG